jgi:hypothetical protein
MIMSNKPTIGLVAALVIGSVFASPALANGGKGHHNRHHGHRHWNFHYGLKHYVPYAHAHRNCGFYYKKWKHFGGHYWKNKYYQCAYWR